MTVTSSSNKVTYAGTGATTVFTFSFIGVGGTDISVAYTDATGVETTLSPSQYSVTINAAAAGQPYGIGGSVTYPLSGSAIAIGTSLTISRQLPIVQGTALGNQGAMYPVAIEGALDYVLMALQQVAELQGRAISTPISDATPPIALPPAAQRALRALIFDSTGQPTVGTLITGTTVSAAMIPVVTAATLALARAAMGIGGTTIYPGGRTSLSATEAVTESDIAGATHVYLCPADSDQTTIWDGSAWVGYTYLTTPDCTLNNPAHTINTNYYMMEAVSAGVIFWGTGPAWASATDPGTGAGTAELEVFQGRLVNKVSITMRNGATTLVVPARQANCRGWIRIIGTSGQTSDTFARRLLGDVLRPAWRPLAVTDPVNSYAYTTTSFRQANANGSNQVDWFHGLSGRSVDLTVSHYATSTNVGAVSVAAGIGIDSTTTNSGSLRQNLGLSTTINPVGGWMLEKYVGYPGRGYHFGAWLELGAANVLFYGDNNTPDVKQSGIIGWTWQ